MTSDPVRLQALQTVAALDLTDCWIGAGFVRDAVWDHLHGYGCCEPKGDVDVLWFDAAAPNAERDLGIEEELRRAMPGLAWSVKNQARMHRRNGDPAYRSVSHATEHWPETATAIAVRLDRSESVEVIAPFGLDDLFGLRLCPTPNFLREKFPIFADRVAAKGWLRRYPKLQICETLRRAGRQRGQVDGRD